MMKLLALRGGSETRSSEEDCGKTPKATTAALPNSKTPSSESNNKEGGK